MAAILNEDRWKSLPLVEQMANIGSEVGRSAKWLSKGKKEMAEGAFYRALDLFDLTIKYGRSGQKSRPQLLRELCRTRESYVQAYISSDNKTLALLEKDFNHYALACRRRM